MIKLNKSPIRKEMLKIPRLLLSYTYFLNGLNTAFISAGYDVESFKLKIIVYKQKSFQVWTFDDWNHLYVNALLINNFMNKRSNNTIPKNNEFSGVETNMHYTLSVHKERKYLTFKTASSEIVLSKIEWNNLYMTLKFFNSIIMWCNSAWKDIEYYFNIYYEKCSLLGVNELPVNKFFVATTYNYCNFSRLFNEIPIFCRYKLLQINRHFSLLNINYSSTVVKT